MNWIFYAVLFPFLLLCLFLMLIILIQRGRGGGLSAAFGGAGGNTAFGAKTGDVLTWVTAAMFGIFMVLAVSLNLMATSLSEQARQEGNAAPVQRTKPTGQSSNPLDSASAPPAAAPVAEPVAVEPTTTPATGVLP